MFRNLIQTCVLTSVAEMEATFDCFTTLPPQFHVEMFRACRENERGSPLAHKSVQA